MIIQLKDQQNVIAKPEDVYAILQAVLAAEDTVDRAKEHCWIFQLNARLRIQALELVSLGTLDANLVHPREVFTRAVANRCHRVLIAHNHPSDLVSPSPEDVEITKRLVQAGDILGIALVDHIIIGESSFLSMKQEGLI